MEEKRRLEKVLFDDINSACAMLRANRQQTREELCEALIKEAPKSVRELYRSHIEALHLADDASKQLQAHGYGIEGYGEMKKLRISHSDKPKALTVFDEATREQERALESLKRTYTVKLFAEGEEAQVLLSSLAKELKAIVNA